MKRTEKYHYFVIFFFCDEKTFCFVIAPKRFIIIKNIKSFGPGNGFQLKFPMFFFNYYGGVIEKMQLNNIIFSYHIFYSKLGKTRQKKSFKPQ